MEYDVFDVKDETGFKSKYDDLHLELVSLLESKPMHIYDLRSLVKTVESSILSSQLQFLKKKKRIISKKFDGTIYYALPKELRKK